MHIQRHNDVVSCKMSSVKLDKRFGEFQHHVLAAMFNAMSCHACMHAGRRKGAKPKAKAMQVDNRA
jgi:hypothetical protein